MPYRQILEASRCYICVHDTPEIQPGSFAGVTRAIDLGYRKGHGAHKGTRMTRGISSSASMEGTGYMGAL